MVMTEPTSAPTSALPGYDGAARALVVDDEEPLTRLVASYLERGGFSVEVAFDGVAAVELARSWSPDLIILDLMLPGLGGVEACRQIRTFSDAYVIMLTARSDEVDKLIGLSVGADDYVTKPFSVRELVARAGAMLRRPRSSEPAPVARSRRVGDLVVDPDSREVTIRGRPVELTRLEFDLLDALSAYPRIAFSRRQLLERMRGDGWYGDEHVIDVHVGHLRRKLGDDPEEPRLIKTIRGVGYRMGTG